MSWTRKPSCVLCNHSKHVEVEWQQITMSLLCPYSTRREFTARLCLSLCRFCYYRYGFNTIYEYYLWSSFSVNTMDVDNLNFWNSIIATITVLYWLTSFILFISLLYINVDASVTSLCSYQKYDLRGPIYFQRLYMTTLYIDMVLTFDFLQHKGV